MAFYGTTQALRNNSKKFQAFLWRSSFIIWIIVLMNIFGHAFIGIARENTDKEPLEVYVDAKVSEGELPYLFRPGIWVQERANFRYILSKFFADNLVGKVQLEIGNNLSRSTSFEDYQERLKKDFALGAPFRQVVDLTKGSQETLIIGHWPGKMPEWLSSRVGDDHPIRVSSGWVPRQLSPPKCYDVKCFNFCKGEEGCAFDQIKCYTAECRQRAEQDLKKQGYVTGWAEVVAWTLRYLRETLGVTNLGYYHGHEQNVDWIGREDEFYQTYAATVKGAKMAHPSIVVGGSGSWSWDASRSRCDSKLYNAYGMEMCKSIKEWTTDGEECKKLRTEETRTSHRPCDPMNKNFLEYAKANNLPVGFLNFHMFGEPPFKDNYDNMVHTMQEWLMQNGFPKDTPLYPADWTRWHGNYTADYLDTESAAAYVAKTLIVMGKSGRWWHGHDFNVWDGGLEGMEKSIMQERGKEAQFIGDWPIFTRGEVIKPVYNTFRLISILAGKTEQVTPLQLKVSMKEDDYTAAVASQTQDGRISRILLSNFIPEQDLLREYVMQWIKKYLKDKGYSKETIGLIYATLSKSIGKQKWNNNDNKRHIKDTIYKAIMSVDFPSPLNNNQIKQDMQECWSDLQSRLQALAQYKKNPRTIKLSVANLPKGSYGIKTYIIDSKHSNSCRYNAETAANKSAPCGIQGAVDRAVADAREKAENKGKETALASFRAKGYPENSMAEFMDAIKTCILDSKKHECITQQINRMCKHQDIDQCRRFKTDMMEAYNKYKTTRGSFYYEAIDRINNSRGVALELFEQKPVFVNGMYQIVINLPPQSVLLLELRME